MTQPTESTESIVSKIKRLSIEEKILNSAYIVSIISLFLPWISGNSTTGESIGYSAFGHYTGFIGLTIFLLLLFVLMIAIVPLVSSKHLIPLEKQEYIRYHVSFICFLFSLCIASVHTKITWEIARLDIRFGLYLCLIGSLIATVYSYLAWDHTKKTGIATPIISKQTAEPEVKNSSVQPIVPDAPQAMDHKPFANKQSK